jgi:hypothetical protein
MKALDTFLTYSVDGWEYGFIKNGQTIVIGNCLKLDDAIIRIKFLLSKDSYWLDMYLAS